MDTSITRPTPVATNSGSQAVSLSTRLLLPFALVLVLPNVGATQEKTLSRYIDLTKPPLTGQQGLGVPGGSGGTFQAPRYKLPLRLEIIHLSAVGTGEFVLQVRLENTGTAPFDLPVSRNISDVQRTPSASRRVFSLAIRQVSPAHAKTWTVAVTAGSASMPHSLLPLQPGESAQVLIQVLSGRLKEAIPTDTRRFDVRVLCDEWTLDDDRFFVRAKSQEIASENAAKFRITDGTVIAAQP